MFKLKRNVPRIISILMLVIMFSLYSLSALAAGGDFGRNAYSWLQDQVFWIALLVVAIVCIPFILKKMWMQLAGFIVLAAIVLFIISSPENLKTLGATIWGKIFG